MYAVNLLSDWEFTYVRNLNHQVSLPMLHHQLNCILTVTVEELKLYKGYEVCGRCISMILTLLRNRGLGLTSCCSRTESWLPRKQILSQAK